MLLDAVSPLANWASFYVITGSSAGALIGLMFVVITLIQGRVQENAALGLAAFTTPTIVQFSAVLVVSAMLSAPWPALWQAALLLGLSGLAFLVYAIIVARRLPRVGGYDPVMEDWLFYAVTPLVAYATLAGAEIILPGNPSLALFAIAAVMILLLITGIHNAWDVVTYMTIVQPTLHAEPAEQGESTGADEPQDEIKG